MIMFQVSGFLCLASGFWFIGASQPETRNQKPETTLPSYEAISANDDDRLQIEAIDAALAAYLAEDISGGQRKAFLIETRGGALAENAFAYGPMAIFPRAVPPELTAALLAAAQDDDRRVRREALYALGSIGPNLSAEQVATLIALVEHEDPGTREAAAAILGRLRASAAADALVNAINDRDTRVKAAAMRALGDLRYERAVQGLNEQLAHYKRGPLALAAFEGLAGIAHTSSAAAFETALVDREAGARRLAAEGLGRAGQTASAPALEAALAKEKDDFAALAMAFALSRLGQPYQHRLADGLRKPRTAPQAFAYFLELAPASRKTLEPLLRDPDGRIRTLAARALDRMK
jgi:HEAT repeat protein